MTACVNQITLDLETINKPVSITFDAPDLSSDGGFLLLQQIDQRWALTQRLADLIPDHRDPNKVRHSRLQQIRQRLFQIVLGYEDQNDATFLRHDPLLKATCGLSPNSQQPLSSQPTLSRLENSISMRDNALLLDDFELFYIDSLDPDRQVVLLDIDTSDDPTHGQQAFTFYNGYYRHYMYHPMFIFDGLNGQLVSAILRPGNKGASRGSGYVLERIIRKVRQKCEDAVILVRGDSAFSVPRLHERIDKLNEELGDVYFLLGQRTNARLKSLSEPYVRQAKQQYEATGKKVRNFHELMYQADSWEEERRVILKAEHNSQGQNPRFVVTSLEGQSGRHWYEAYCQRGNAENWIKDLMNAMAADRLSCETFEANFFRLLLHGWAYRLMWLLREEVKRAGETERKGVMRSPQINLLGGEVHENQGLIEAREERGEQIEEDESSGLMREIEAVGRMQFDTLRLRLLKVGVWVRESVRRIWLQLPQSFGHIKLFRRLLQRGEAALVGT